MQSKFDESVWDIVGLTEYRPRTLPDWLRERLDELFGALEDDPTDEELAQRHVDEGRGWLADWGTAVIAGQSVLICDCDSVDWELLDTVYIAELLHCGLVFVERSEHFDEVTVYFTEEHQYAKRDRSEQQEVCAEYSASPHIVC